MRLVAERRVDGVGRDAHVVAAQEERARRRRRRSPAMKSVGKRAPRRARRSSRRSCAASGRAAARARPPRCGRRGGPPARARRRPAPRASHDAPWSCRNGARRAGVTAQMATTAPNRRDAAGRMELVAAIGRPDASASEGGARWRGRARPRGCWIGASQRRRARHRRASRVSWLFLSNFGPSRAPPRTVVVAARVATARIAVHTHTARIAPTLPTVKAVADERTPLPRAQAVRRRPIAAWTSPRRSMLAGALLCTASRVATCRWPAGTAACGRTCAGSSRR